MFGNSADQPGQGICECIGNAYKWISYFSINMVYWYITGIKSLDKSDLQRGDI